MNKKGKTKREDGLVQKVKEMDFESNENSYSLQSADPLVTPEIKRGATMEQNYSKVVFNKKMKQSLSISKYQDMNVMKMIPVRKQDKKLNDYVEEDSDYQQEELEQIKDQKQQINKEQTQKQEQPCSNSIFQIHCSQITKKHNKETYTIKIPYCRGSFSSCIKKPEGKFQYKQGDLILYQMQLINSKYQIKIHGQKSPLPTKFSHCKHPLPTSSFRSTFSSQYFQNKQLFMSSYSHYNPISKQISIPCKQFNIKNTGISMLNTLFKTTQTKQQQCIIYEKQQRFYLQIKNNKKLMNNHLVILCAISRIDALKNSISQEQS